MADAFLMKGKVYGERKHLLLYPVWAEIKYDEIRLHVRYDAASEEISFLSYAGNYLSNFEHWAERFRSLMREQRLTDLDCGVLVNGNFNDSYRWVRSTSGIPKEKLDKKTGKIAPALDTTMVQFYLFDLPTDGLAFEPRMRVLDALATLMDVTYRIPTKRPTGQLVWNEEGLDAHFVWARESGYEGLMVKTLTHLYEPGKRVDGWLKMKPENSADGVITKLNQAHSLDGTPLPRVGSIDVLLEDGSTASPAGINHTLGALMFMNPDEYLGGWLEFKYMERDRQGGYRHPSMVRLREDK